mmetsp:Transcript_1029/g.1304  ORF Transcript_1029/g.1304 Transcript_1029/m.1304 type:complete len:83 (+) Transcript_1029:1033-1281(+)
MICVLGEEKRHTFVNFKTVYGGDDGLELICLEWIDFLQQRGMCVATPSSSAQKSCQSQQQHTHHIQKLLSFLPLPIQLFIFN